MPLPSSDPAAEYGRPYFVMHQPWRRDYHAMADILDRHLRGPRAVDFGCGNGFLLERLAELGWEVTGVDGSPHALAAAPAAIRRHIKMADLGEPLWIGRFDLVLCTEVAEHLPESAADALVGNIAVAASDQVFFTAATPGQGGHGHLNEQPHRYWINKFAKHSLRLDQPLTNTLRRELKDALKQTWWFAKNAMVFD